MKVVLCLSLFAAFLVVVSASLHCCAQGNNNCAAVGKSCYDCKAVEAVDGECGSCGTCAGGTGTCQGTPTCTYAECYTVGQCLATQLASYDPYIINDPHFRGLNGRKYDFQGEPNKVFALLSEQHVQVNALFVNASGMMGSKRGKVQTVLGEVCVRFCDSTVVFQSAGSLVVKPNGPATSNLVVDQLSDTAAKVTAGLWTFSVELGWDQKSKRHFLNIQHVQLQHPVLAGKVHGVLGVTLPDLRANHPLNHTAPHPHCNPQNEGGCEVPGEWQDYEVTNNDLCGIAFQNSQFNAGKCAEIAHQKRGEPEINILKLAEAAIIH